MRKILLSAALVGVVGFGVVLGCGLDVWAVDGKPIALPWNLACGKVLGEKVVAVTNEGALVEVDLAAGKAREIGPEKTRLLPCLDARAGKLCVASAEEVFVLAEGTGKALHTLSFKGEGVRAAGFVDDNRVLVQTGKAVQVLDLSSGKPACTIEVSKVGERAEPVHFCVDGKKLYLTHPAEGALLIADIESGKLLDTIKVPAWRIGGLHVEGDRAHVVGLRLGYGVWTESLAVIDLKTKKHTLARLPRDLSALASSTVVVGPGGNLVISGDNSNTCYDREGKPLGTIGEGKGKVIGFCSRRMAVLVAGNKLSVAPASLKAPAGR